MKRVLYLLFLGILGGLIFRGCFFECIVVPTASMEPTVKKGEVLWVNKFIYHFRKPERGDIIVFKSPVENKVLVKRIIGLPGETIEIKNKKVYINGKELKEDYVEYLRKEEILVGDNIPEMVIPDDAYFVMGDNRDYSKDSRDWKDEEGNPVRFIYFEDIKGKVIGR